MSVSRHDDTNDRWRWRVLLLAYTAGTMDALSYLLAHVFPANMTGNTVVLGIAVGLGHHADASRAVTALAAYVVGVGVSVLVLHRTRHETNPTHAVMGALVLEGFLLACFTVLWHVAPVAQSAVQHVMVAVAAAAMGVQSASVMRLKMPGVVTTYITGTITALVTGIVRHLRLESDENGARQESAGAARYSSIQLQAGVFGVYLAAAIITAVVHRYAPNFATYLPLCAITAVIVRSIVKARRFARKTPLP